MLGLSQLGALLSVSILALPGQAHAVPPTECHKGVAGHDCVIRATDPADDESNAGKPTTPRAGKATCQFRGVEIDCTSALGTWSNSRQCTVERAEPQPPKTDPIWDGRDDGVIYWCVPPYFSLPLSETYRFWGPPDTPLLDPVVLAEEAVTRMHLKAPQLGTTPLNPEAPMVVGVPTWLWLADDPQSYGPITRTATAGGTTVTATARVTAVTWDLGDGTTLTCPNAGTPWTPERGTGPSPTCGHTYQRPSIDQPDRTFDLTATTHWQVDWSGAGQTGQITLTLTGTRQLEVTEVQVLQTR